MITGEQPQKSNQLLAVLGLVGFVMETIFPSFLMIKISHIVGKFSWEGDQWFRDEQRQCLKLIVALLIPSVIGIYGSYRSIRDLQVNRQIIDRPVASLKNKKFGKAQDEALKALASLPIKSAGRSIALWFALPSLISFYIRARNPILRKTRKFRKVLKRQGFWRDGKPGLAVYTPVGFLVDVTGHNPKDVALDHSIWQAMNVTVDEREYVEKPDQRSIILFKTAFVLKHEYHYK
jgi:hypothetical protein